MEKENPDKTYRLFLLKAVTGTAILPVSIREVQRRSMELSPVFGAVAVCAAVTFVFAVEADSVAGVV